MQLYCTTSTTTATTITSTITASTSATTWNTHTCTKEEGLTLTSLDLVQSLFGPGLVLVSSGFDMVYSWFRGPGFDLVSVLVLL